MVTLLWYFCWWLADDPVRLSVDPVNGWTIALITAVVLDLGSTTISIGRGRE